MGATGSNTLYLALTTPAANDTFANRIKLHAAFMLWRPAITLARFRNPVPLPCGIAGH